MDNSISIKERNASELSKADKSSEYDAVTLKYIMIKFFFLVYFAL